MSIRTLIDFRLVYYLGMSLIVIHELAAAERPAARPYAPTSTLVTPKVTSTSDYRPTYPIDLLTALRLVDGRNPTIEVARAKVREATAFFDRTRLLWIPNLSFGPTLFYHQGIDQNRRGDTFIVSRGNYTLGVGPILRVDLSDALYQPLVARQIVRATQAQAAAISNNIQLEVAIAYLDLLELYGLKAINMDILDRAEQILAAARAGAKAGLNKSAADVNRAATEVNLRREEALVLCGRISSASARLVRLLNLDPSIELIPLESSVIPLTLVPGHLTLEQLIQVALRNRPEVRASLAGLAAAEQLLLKSKSSLLLPRVQGEFIAGGLSGGVNGNFGPLTSQYNAGVSLVWNLESFGFGNAAAIRGQRAGLEAAIAQLREVQALVSSQVVEAAQTAAARFESLEVAQAAINEAEEMYFKYRATSFGMVGPKAQFDPLEPLTAVQALNIARVQYLEQVVEFNRAQFRLYTAIGQPTLSGLDQADPQPLAVPAIPPLPNPNRK